MLGQERRSVRRSRTVVSRRPDCAHLPSQQLTNPAAAENHYFELFWRTPGFSIPVGRLDNFGLRGPEDCHHSDVV